MNEQSRIEIEGFLEILTPEEGIAVLKRINARFGESSKELNDEGVAVVFGLLERALRTMAATIGRVETKDGEATLYMLMVSYETDESQKPRKKGADKSGRKARNSRKPQFLN